MAAVKTMENPFQHWQAGEDLYHPLGLAQGASHDAVCEAYSRLMLHHASAGLEPPPAIQHAYEVLSRPELKQLYDAQEQGYNKQEIDAVLGNGDKMSENLKKDATRMKARRLTTTSGDLFRDVLKKSVTKVLDSLKEHPLDPVECKHPTCTWESEGDYVALTEHTRLYHGEYGRLMETRATDCSNLMDFFDLATQFSISFGSPHGIASEAAAWGIGHATLAELGTCSAAAISEPTPPIPPHAEAIGDAAKFLALPSAARSQRPRTSPITVSVIQAHIVEEIRGAVEHAATQKQLWDRKAPSTTERIVLRTDLLPQSVLLDINTHGGNNLSALVPQWPRVETRPPFQERQMCQVCQTTFTFFNRRHHCRVCARSICNVCTRWRRLTRFGGIDQPERVCEDCVQAERKREAAQWWLKATAPGPGRVDFVRVQFVLAVFGPLLQAELSATAEQNTIHPALRMLCLQAITKQPLEQVFRTELTRVMGLAPTTRTSQLPALLTDAMRLSIIRPDAVATLLEGDQCATLGADEIITSYHTIELHNNQWSATAMKWLRKRMHSVALYCFSRMTPPPAATEGDVFTELERTVRTAAYEDMFLLWYKLWPHVGTDQSKWRAVLTRRCTARQEVLTQLLMLFQRIIPADRYAACLLDVCQHAVTNAPTAVPLLAHGLSPQHRLLVLMTAIQAGNAALAAGILNSIQASMAELRSSTTSRPTLVLLDVAPAFMAAQQGKRNELIDANIANYAQKKEWAVVELLIRARHMGADDHAACSARYQRMATEFSEVVDVNSAFQCMVLATAHSTLWGSSSDHTQSTMLHTFCQLMLKNSHRNTQEWVLSVCATILIKRQFMNSEETSDWDLLAAQCLLKQNASDTCVCQALLLAEAANKQLPNEYGQRLAAWKAKSNAEQETRVFDGINRLMECYNRRYAEALCTHLCDTFEQGDDELLAAFSTSMSLAIASNDSPFARMAFSFTEGLLRVRKGDGAADQFFSDAACAFPEETRSALARVLTSKFYRSVVFRRLMKDLTCLLGLLWGSRQLDWISQLPDLTCAISERSFAHKHDSQLHHSAHRRILLCERGIQRDYPGNSNALTRAMMYMDLLAIAEDNTSKMGVMTHTIGELSLAASGSDVAREQSAELCMLMLTASNVAVVLTQHCDAIVKIFGARSIIGCYLRAYCSLRHFSWEADDGTWLGSLVEVLVTNAVRYPIMRIAAMPAADLLYVGEVHTMICIEMLKTASLLTYPTPLYPPHMHYVEWMLRMARKEIAELPTEVPLLLKGHALLLDEEVARRSEQLSNYERLGLATQCVANARELSEQGELQRADSEYQQAVQLYNSVYDHLQSSSPGATIQEMPSPDRILVDAIQASVSRAKLGYRLGWWWWTVAVADHAATMARSLPDDAEMKCRLLVTTRCEKTRALAQLGKRKLALQELEEVRVEAKRDAELRDMIAETRSELQFLDMQIERGVMVDASRCPTIENARVLAMATMLASLGLTMEGIQNKMVRDAVPRDAQGWMLPIGQHRLCDMKFHALHGFEFELPDKFSLYVELAGPGKPGLFSEDDVLEMTRNLQIHWMSTMSMDSELPLSNCGVLGSMIEGSFQSALLHLQYLVMQLASGIEVSAYAPFRMRRSEITTRLPEHLRNAIRPIASNDHVSLRITSGNGAANMIQRRSGMVFLFGDGDLEVVNMGSSEDATRFAQELSRNYRELGKYLPELRRVVELQKMLTMGILRQLANRNDWVIARIAEAMLRLLPEWPFSESERHIEAVTEQVFAEFAPTAMKNNRDQARAIAVRRCRERDNVVLEQTSKLFKDHLSRSIVEKLLQSPRNIHALSDVLTRHLKGKDISMLLLTIVANDSRFLNDIGGNREVVPTIYPLSMLGRSLSCEMVLVPFSMLDSTLQQRPTHTSVVTLDTGRKGSGRPSLSVKPSDEVVFATRQAQAIRSLRASEQRALSKSSRTPSQAYWIRRYNHISKAGTERKQKIQHRLLWKIDDANLSLMQKGQPPRDGRGKPVELRMLSNGDLDEPTKDEKVERDPFQSLASSRRR